MKNKAINYLNSLIKDSTTKSEIDIIEYCKKCVRNYKEENKKQEKSFDWSPFFETLWKMYPRKVNKQLAKKTFEHKVRGLDEEQCREKCNKIYKVQMLRQEEWKANKTELQFIAHYSTFLNANVPNSEHYKGL